MLSVMLSEPAFVPKDKFDLETARRARDAGWPAVDADLTNLVDWCLDSNWPVAQVLGPFLGRVGAPVLPAVRSYLTGSDEPAKYHLLVGIVAFMAPTVRAELDEHLRRFLEDPTSAEVAEGLPELAGAILDIDG